MISERPVGCRACCRRLLYCAASASGRQFAGGMLMLAAALWSQRDSLTSENLLTALPTGSSGVATVPLFNAWSIWWNADRLTHGFQSYWDAPIFFPEQRTFAFSEPQPATLAAAPVYWFTDHLVLAYKFYLLLSLLLNGIFAQRLLRCLGVNRWPALAGALVVLLLPIVHQQNDVLQLMPLWAILWTWERLFLAACTPSLRTGCVAGVAFGVCFLISVHHGLFQAALMPAAFSMLRFRDIRNPEVWKASAAFVITAAALAAPLLLPIHQAMQEFEFTRTDRVVTALSAGLTDYLTLPKSALFSLDDSDLTSLHRLQPGWCRTLLALIGLAWGLRKADTRRLTLFLAATCLLALLLSFGNHLQLGQWTPWHSLCEWVPGFAQVRNVFRFAYFVQLSISIMAAAGLTAILPGDGPGQKSADRQVIQGISTSTVLRSRVGFPAVALLAVVVIAEVPPERPRLARVPDMEDHRQWTEFVRTQLTPGRSVLCLPCSAGTKVKQFEPTVRWMYLGTAHGRPLVNGYSGFFPPGYFRLQEALNAIPADPALPDLLAAADVELIVIDTSLYDPQRLAALSGCIVQELLQADNGIVVCRFERLLQNR